jgi:hypothetical protein
MNFVFGYNMCSYVMHFCVNIVEQPLQDAIAVNGVR